MSSRRRASVTATGSSLGGRVSFSGAFVRVDAVQPRERGAELAHDGLAVAGALRLPQHPAGDGLAVEPLTQEERAAEVLRVGAHAPDAWRRHARLGGELADSGLGADVDELDVGGGQHGRDQPLDPVVAHRVEQQVAPARASGALREVLDLDLTTALVCEPGGETLFRSHVSSLVHCSYPGFEMARSSRTVASSTS